MSPATVFDGALRGRSLETAITETNESGLTVMPVGTQYRAGNFFPPLSPSRMHKAVWWGGEGWWWWWW